MPDERLKLYYPFQDNALVTKGVKAFFEKELAITEVSFPSREINVLRVETEEYVLKCRRIPKRLESTFRAFAKSLAAVLKEVPASEQAVINEPLIKLSKKDLGIISQSDVPSNWRCMSPGWYRLSEEMPYEDFFTD